MPDNNNNDDDPSSTSRKKGVRFAPSVHEPGVSNNNNNNRHSRKRAGVNDSELDDTQHVRTHSKRPRMHQQQRLYEDEMDDVDDWKDSDDNEGDDDAGNVVVTEKELLLAKTKRRSKREGVEDSEDDEDVNETHIDQTTSLASEGIAIEPFNMDKEQSDGTGYFDGDTYVFRKRTDEEEPDAWLESLQQDGKGDQNSHYKGKRRDDDGNSSDSGSEDQVNAEMEDQKKMDNWSKDDLYDTIIPLVSDTETIMEAIIRYGALLKRAPGKNTTTSSSSETMKAAKESLDTLTEVSNALLLQGQVDIYQMTRNQLLASTSRRSANEALAAAAPASNSSGNKQVVMWEYQGSQDGQVHGLYSTKDMLNWINAGYFVGSSAVKTRYVMEREVEKTTQDDLLNDLESDDEQDATESTNKKETVRGEWMQSDRIDFTIYN